MSGVTQGSVLGQLLFLIFISDLDLGVLSTIFKFADDTKIFLRVMTPADRSQLQKDLDILCEWAGNWKMTFSVKKCNVMHTGTNNYDYSMNGQSLDRVSEHKDFGIIVSRLATLKQQITVTMCAMRQIRCWDLSNSSVKYRTTQHWYSYTKAW